MSIKKSQTVTEDASELAVTDVLSDQVEVENKTSADFVEYVQNQFNGVKTEVKQRINNVMAKFPVNTDDFIGLKDTLKTEFLDLYADVAETSKAFKAEVIEVSLKHKTHLLEGFKRSKEHTYDAINKINLSKVKDDQSAL